MRLNRDKTRWDWKHYLPDPRHISDKWQSISPGSLHNSTTSRHSVSGVTGTSVKCWSLLLRYTVRNIWGQQEGTDKEKHKMEVPGSLCESKTNIMSHSNWCPISPWFCVCYNWPLVCIRVKGQMLMERTRVRENICKFQGQDKEEERFPFSHAASLIDFKS